jgi:riboflavin kinase / FMN adenylyltransferase
MFQGKVIHGNNIGSKLGYPTANLNTPIEKLEIITGIYAAEISLHGKEYHAALIIDTSIKKVEAFLFDYTGESFYGTVLQVEPIQKVSDIMPFEKSEDLKEKIKQDIQKVRDVFDVL